MRMPVKLLCCVVAGALMAAAIEKNGFAIAHSSAALAVFMILAPGLWPVMLGWLANMHPIAAWGIAACVNAGFYFLVWSVFSRLRGAHHPRRPHARRDSGA